MVLNDAIKIAKEVRKNAYVPYCKYYVGVALVTKSGKIYSGCNIQDTGIASICAERVAFLKAISEGEKDFDYLVVCGGDKLDSIDPNCTPCGYCRQFLAEFVDKDFKIYALTNDNEAQIYTLEDLLPHSFKV